MELTWARRVCGQTKKPSRDALQTSEKFNWPFDCIASQDGVITLKEDIRIQFEGFWTALDTKWFSR